MEKQSPPPYDTGFTNPQSSASAPYGTPPYTQQPHPQEYPSAPYGQPFTPYTQQPHPQVLQPAVVPLAPMNTSTTVHVNTGAGGVGCPVCHNNSWTGSYSCCAWLWLICCFPIGIICCCCMRKKKCTKCGFTLG